MDERLKVYDSKMTKSFDALLRDYAAIRAGRANPHVLDKIKWNPDSTSAGRKYFCTGGKNHSDPAVGEKADP